MVGYTFYLLSALVCSPSATGFTKRTARIILFSMLRPRSWAGYRTYPSGGPAAKRPHGRKKHLPGENWMTLAYCRCVSWFRQLLLCVRAMHWSASLVAFGPVSACADTYSLGVCACPR